MNSHTTDCKSETKSNWKHNKTVGYHWHILRPPIFVKKAFKKKHSSYFLTFPTFKIFWFSLKKNLIIRAVKTFLRNYAIWYAFCCKFATFIDFENFKFFFEKPVYFFKKTPNFECFEKSYFFSRILRELCYNLVKKTSRSVTWTYCRCWRERNWQTSGKKNVGNGPFEGKILLLIS